MATTTTSGANGNEQAKVSTGEMSTMQSTANENTKYVKRNTKSYKNLSYFIGGIDVTHQNLDQLTPYIPGVSRLFMHKVPYFMSVAFPEMTSNFKSYVETGYKAVSGINDLSAEFATISGGFAEQSFENISKVSDSSNEMQITLYEQTGSPVREFIETWMTGVRDPRSGIAHYHGVVEIPGTTEATSATGTANSAFEAVPYCEKNHTAEFMFYDLDPTAHYIEYAALFAHCFPKNVEKSHYNYTSGSRDTPELNLQFSMTKYESRYINDIAVWYLIKDQIEYNYLNFNPNINNQGANHDLIGNYDLNLGGTETGGTTTKAE